MFRDLSAGVKGEKKQKNFFIILTKLLMINYKKKKFQSSNVSTFPLFMGVKDSYKEDFKTKTGVLLLDRNSDIKNNIDIKCHAFENSRNLNESPEINSKNESIPVLIRRYMIVGERRMSNYWWAFVISLGAFGFLITGLSSYLGFNFIPFFNSQLVSFFPQGLLMSFYGGLGILLSLYWWFLIYWNVGSGFNEFNKKDRFIRIFRWGYPGKNRRIDLSYPLNDLEAIKVELKQGLDSQRTIYMRLKGKREIPLTGVGQPLTLKDIEKQASELASFLQVSLEGL